jgi:hypothetical protein
MSDEMEDRQKDSIGPYMGSTIEEDLYNEDMMEKDPKTLKDRDMIVNSQATTEDEESQSQIPLVNKGKMKAQEVPNIGAIEGNQQAPKCSETLTNKLQLVLLLVVRL